MHFSHMYYFFFNDTATTEIYTLSLHDALPICGAGGTGGGARGRTAAHARERHCVVGGRRDRHVESWRGARREHQRDRKSTRLESRHANISYAVFCFKKNK